MNEQTTYTGYEYKRVTAETGMESIWKDSLANFGWTGEKSEAKVVKRLPVALWILAAPLSLLPGGPFRKQLGDHASSKQVEITFKRARTLPRKQELDQLEAKFEHCARSIESLNASKGGGGRHCRGCGGPGGHRGSGPLHRCLSGRPKPGFRRRCGPRFSGVDHPILPAPFYESVEGTGHRT